MGRQFPSVLFVCLLLFPFPCHCSLPSGRAAGPSTCSAHGHADSHSQLLLSTSLPERLLWLTAVLANTFLLSVMGFLWSAPLSGAQVIGVLDILICCSEVFFLLFFFSFSVIYVLLIVNQRESKRE